MPKKSKNSLVPTKKESGLSHAEMMNHPVIREMSVRIETMGRLLENLPRLIGEAVAQATRSRAPLPPPAPGQSLEIDPAHARVLREMADMNHKREHPREIGKVKR